MTIDRKYITVYHCEDGKTPVRAKVIKETDSEISVEYKYGGIMWGLTIPKTHKEYAKLR